MTSEEIAELRKAALDEIENPTDEHSDDALHAFLRVLDEREALLKFARRMDSTLDRSLYQSELAECAAAITLAEAPIPPRGSRESSGGTPPP